MQSSHVHMMFDPQVMHPTRLLLHAPMCTCICMWMMTRRSCTPRASSTRPRRGRSSLWRMRASSSQTARSRRTSRASASRSSSTSRRYICMHAHAQTHARVHIHAHAHCATELAVRASGPAHSFYIWQSMLDVIHTHAGHRLPSQPARLTVTLTVTVSLTLTPSQDIVSQVNPHI